MIQNKIPEMSAWPYQIDDGEKSVVRIQIDKRHAEFTFIKGKGKEVATIHRSNGDHIASVFELENNIFKRFYPKVEFIKDKLPKEPRKKKDVKSAPAEGNILEFLAKQPHSKSEILKKFKILGKGTLDKMIRDLIKQDLIVIEGQKKAAKYKVKK